MHHVLTSLTMWLLLVSAACAAPSAHGASGTPNVFQTGPTYHYILKQDKNPAVCKHMLRAFNDRFTHLWDAPLMPWSKSDQSYSSSSKYAFPLLPGVKHSTEATYEMRFSAQPTSPEFSAIHWKEGNAILGGCPASECPWDYKLLPILVAHFDYDNDGTIDTVIKQQFFAGYSLKDRSQEYLIVWRDQSLTIQDLTDMSKLMHPQNPTLEPISSSGLYLRPFIYAGHAYVARYVYADPGDSDTTANSVPWFMTPKTQDMLVQQYSFTGQKQQFTGRPEWTVHTICDFEMKPLNNAGRS